jgi:[acyl-carrier-protein] S-malonyltransferase
MYFRARVPSIPVWVKIFMKNFLAAEMFQKADEILGFEITGLMFEGNEEDLKQTKVTQPAIFLHSVVLARILGRSFQPGMAAGHSLGEFSALVATGALSFEDGLNSCFCKGNGHAESL